MRTLKTKLKLLYSAMINPRIYRTIQAVRGQKLTYLNLEALLELYEAVESIERRGEEGILIEAGVALGGSTIVMASAKSQKRPLLAYDVFSTIPPPSPGDGADAHGRYAVIASGQAEGIGGDTYYGYQDNLLTKVRENFVNFGINPSDHHIIFYPGLFEETLRVSQPVSLAHIDCDWYESVMLCLEQIVPNLISGGILVIDDYEDWSGCKRAVDEYFEGRSHEFSMVMKSKLHIEKLA
jgi:asparagine synthase (glutamine-hydrolysing)